MKEILKVQECDCFWSDTGHCLCPVSCNDYKKTLLAKISSDQIKWGRKKVRTDKRNWKNIVERFE